MNRIRYCLPDFNYPAVGIRKQVKEVLVTTN
jgi:hypothetical protein